MFRPTRPMAPFGIILALVVFAGTNAVTKAQPPATETLHRTIADTVPEIICGEPVDVDVEAKQVLHMTEFDDGRYHTHGTTVGNVELELHGVTYTGRFKEQSGENSNGKSFSTTFTFNATLRGDDGSRIALRGRAHVTVSADGDITVEFEEFAETCPA